MADPNISNILAALAAQQQRPNGTPGQVTQSPLTGPPFPHQYGPPPGAVPPYGLPQPISSGSVDLNSIKPISSGSVSIADTIAKARGIAAEKGIEPGRDPRISSRGYRRSRSPSRTPPRSGRDNFRDNYNPYRDERRGGGDRDRVDRGGYNRERSLSPRRDVRYSPSYGGGSPIRRGADGDSEIVPIEKSLVGLIIGRSGENLRRVEGSTGARVQFMDGPESAGASRHCKISGTRSARASAKAEIFRIIEDNEAAKRGGGGGGGGGGPDKSRGHSKAAAPPTSATPMKDGESLQIMVPDRTVGLIIGRGGETIRDLQERSGCHVNIVGENKSISGMRPVNLIGPPESQRRAQDLIYEIVESDNKGTSIKAVMGREDPYGSSPDKINDSIMVPGDAVGMIIGKGGESIREMQNQTGCKINVSPPAGRDAEREIGLVGTRSAIDAAKRAIMDKVDAVDQRNREAGGSTGGGRDARPADTGYGDRYGAQPVSYSPAGIAQPPQQQPGGPPAAGAADPYAPYGGYQNYLTMWYAAMQAQQQQQGGQGQGEQR